MNDLNKDVSEAVLTRAKLYIASKDNKLMHELTREELMIELMGSFDLIQRVTDRLNEAREEIHQEGHCI